MVNDHSKPVGTRPDSNPGRTSPGESHRIPPLRSLVFAEFDADIGPVITYQTPDEVLTAKFFENIAGYIIPKHQLLRRLMKLNFPDVKIMGYPVGIDNDKYKRCRYQFNLCFVVSNVSHVDCAYEPLVQKLGHYLIALEKESEFLSNVESKQKNLPTIMAKIFEELNQYGECSIDVSERTAIHLKLSPMLSLGAPPPKVAPHMVPVFLNGQTTNAFRAAQLSRMDVLSQKIVPFIDGYRTVLEIGRETEIDADLVLRCCRNLQFYGHLTFVPLFQYSNIYVVTERIAALNTDTRLQKECQKFVALRSMADSSQPSVSNILRLYSSLQYGITLANWCPRQQPREVGVDERRLVQYGVIHALIRKVYGYPVFIGKETTRHRGTDSGQRATFESDCDGNRSVEDLCCKYGLTPKDLIARIEAADRFMILWK